MRKSIFFSAVLSLFLLVPASITWAQTISTQKGLTTAVFNTPAGTIKVYLPDDIRSGEVISGTVLAEPIGKNAKQVEKNLSELIKYTVSIDGNRTSVPSKPGLMKWLLHSGGKQISPIEFINGSGAKVGQISFQLSSLDKTISASPQNCSHPSHAMTGTCGAKLAATLLSEDLCDELLLYIAPVLLGDQARPLLNGMNRARLADATRLTLIEQVRIGDDLRLRLRRRS